MVFDYTAYKILYELNIKVLRNMKYTAYMTIRIFLFEIIYEMKLCRIVSHFYYTDMTVNSL